MDDHRQEAKTVLFIAPRFHTNMTGWVRALKGAEIRVRVFVQTKGFIEDYEAIEPEKMKPSILAVWRISREGRRSPNTPPEDVWRRFFRPRLLWLACEIRREKFSVIVVREETGLFFPIWIVAKFFSRESSVFRYHQRPLCVESKRKSLKRRLRSGIENVIFGSDASPEISPVLARRSLTDDEFRKFAEQHVKNFVPFLVPIEEPQALREDDGILRILAIGKFREYKSFDLLVQTLKTLELEKAEKLEIQLVGQARLAIEIEYLERLRRGLLTVPPIRSLKITSNVEPKLMKDFYRWASCTLLTSRYEVAAISPLEGMGYGAFPITTSENGTNCYFEDGKSGLVFPAGDALSLCGTITGLIHSPDRVSRLREGAREAIRERASVNAFGRIFPF